MPDSRPIGVFDSGVGGLTVASALMTALPGESILYLGDTARLPYGTKSPQTVQRYTRRNLDFLASRGVKAIIVACNTASALALDTVYLELPTWGVIEPGARVAVDEHRRRGHCAKQPIGVLATESTVRSDAYARAIRRLDPDATVRSIACPLFVPLVEEGWTDDDVTRLVAERYLRPLLDEGADTLVLGCTHYPALRGILGDLVGPDVALVDSAESVAEVVRRELAESDLLAADHSAPSHHLCVTDVEARFERIAAQLLPSRTATLELVEV